MSRHTATLQWTRTTPEFTYEGYDRGHTLTYECGLRVEASAAAGFAGDAAKLNPEESFVGALSSCHMLTFLAIAARKRLVVDSYVDQAEGFLEKNTAGKLAMTRVVLHPAVRFSADTPVTPEALTRLHDSAHANCFIALSVNSDVTIEPAPV